MTKWDKPLQGENARLINTLDQPGWCYRFTFSRPSYQAMEQLTMCFTGGRKVKTTTIAPLRLSTAAWRSAQLLKVKNLGVKNDG